MKYVKDGVECETQELSMLETLRELADVVHIAKMMCRGIHKDVGMPDSVRGDAESAYKNLDEAEHYIPYERTGDGAVCKAGQNAPLCTG